ncbi:MAG: pilin [Candidatus Saccharibacteria bacterium]|nr:pilin [Candidatus Saccharibacteria bacterium]
MGKKTIQVVVAALLAIPLMAVSLGVFVPTDVFAQSSSCNNSLTISNGANCAQGNQQPSNLFGLGGVFQTIVNISLYVIGAISVLMLIYGGIRYTTSGGDAKNVTAAKNTILYAIVGIVVAILAYAIVNFVITSLAPIS